MRRTLSILALVMVALAVAPPLLAVEDTTTTAPAGAEEGQEGIATTVAQQIPEPALPAPEPPPDLEDQPWTTRYLVPTTLLLAALVVVATVVQYFVRVVRSRYKLVK
jgi:phosphatidylglycerophosphate synthase